MNGLTIPPIFTVLLFVSKLAYLSFEVGVYMLYGLFKRYPSFFGDEFNEYITYPHETSFPTLRVPVDIVRFLDHIRYQTSSFLFFHVYCKYSTLLPSRGGAAHSTPPQGIKGVCRRVLLYCSDDRTRTCNNLASNASNHTDGSHRY